MHSRFSRLTDTALYSYVKGFAATAGALTAFALLYKAKESSDEKSK